MVVIGLEIAATVELVSCRGVYIKFCGARVRYSEWEETHLVL